MTNLMEGTQEELFALLSGLSERGITLEIAREFLADPAKFDQWARQGADLNPPANASSLTVAEVFADDSRLRAEMDMKPEDLRVLLNILRHEDVRTLGELADCTEEEVARFRLVGATRLDRIKKVLEFYNLQFSESVDGGARRVPYQTRYRGTASSCRRDRVGKLPIQAFVWLGEDAERDQPAREAMTVDEFCTADDETLRRLFSSGEIRLIREWITIYKIRH